LRGLARAAAVQVHFAVAGILAGARALCQVPGVGAAELGDDVALRLPVER
jgi:hypothetical protein